MRKRLLITVIAGAALAGVGFLSGCLDEPNRSPRRNTPAFSHAKHVVDEDLKCDVCHKTADKSQHAGMPTVKSCMKCHEGLDAKKPPERSVAAYVKDGQPQWSKVTLFSPEVKFSHQVHSDAKIECASCHKGIESSKEVTSRLRVTMQDCIKCHAQTQVGAGALNTCAQCHTYIGKDWKPENHRNNWKELHGRDAGFAAKGSTMSCELCHTQQSCIQCHRDEQPKNHSNHFRLRGHGIAASLDRAACKTCHTEDSCLRCHQSVAPSNHRGNFESRHCLNCHAPLKDTGCFACHKDDRSHQLSPRLPSNKVHVTAKSEECRDCHFGLKLRHIDNGEDCLSCHRR